MRKFLAIIGAGIVIVGVLMCLGIWRFWAGERQMASFCKSHARSAPSRIGCSRRSTYSIRDPTSSRATAVAAVPACFRRQIILVNFLCRRS